jgi:hypothetical protein
MKTLDKIDAFIDEDILETDEYDRLEDDEIVDAMFNLILTIDERQLTDEQAFQVMEIIDGIDFDYDENLDLDEDLDEDALVEVFKKRVRRDIGAARKRRREHLRKRARRKVAGRKYRRSAAGKKTARKAKRFGKFGRTSTMKRQRKFVGPKLSKIRR